MDQADKTEDDVIDTVIGAQLKVFHAQRVAALMSKPIYSDDDLVAIFGIPKSSLLLLKKTLRLPQFSIGKRRFTTREALLTWIEAQAGKGQL
jgi:hypothetical protein